MGLAEWQKIHSFMLSQRSQTG